MTEASAEEKPKRASSGRSPNYPGIPLPTAIERARIVWEKERRNPAPVRVIMKHWGYTNPKGGLAGVTFGALKKFGLIEDEGSGLERPAKLTDLAFEILNNPNAADAVKRAALLPPIHTEMWSQYGLSLPSEDTLKWELMRRGFTASGATEFIREYRETVAYAKLADGAAEGASDDTQDRDRQDNDPERGAGAAEQKRDKPPRGGGVNGKTLTIPVPVIGGAPVIIEGEFPISEAAWSQFMAVLTAMKPGLVSEPKPENEPE